MSVDTAYRVSPLHRGDPERLGEYRLTGRLGSGGMGTVYLGLDPDDCYVAIKLVHANLAHDPEFRGRFRSEVDRARQVPSFCTAEVYDANLDHDPPYLVVEYVDGPNLAEVVDDRGPLKAANLHSVAVGVATALAGIHGAGVIHRDLKPENVLLAPGSPKVIDFGIARAFEATSQYTRTDQMVGTVAYMAPERFSSRPGTDLTAAADIFAWGCVVGYAGTGRTPFHGDSPPATAARILTQPPHLDGLAEPLRSLVELSLAKEPEDRPTAPELLDMLVGDRPVPRPRPAAQFGAQTQTAVVQRPDLLQPAHGYGGYNGYDDYDNHPLRPAGMIPGQPGRTRRSSGAGWLALLAVLLVIAGVGTVAAVLGLGGDVGDSLVSGPQASDGGAAAGVAVDPAGKATTVPPSAALTRKPQVPATTTRPVTRKPGPAEPTDGEVIIQDPLDQPGQWLDSEIREIGASCFTKGVMQADLIARGTFQCHGPEEEIRDDFGVLVTTSLQTAGSCAGIWFHWTPAAGGHVLKICQNTMSVGADKPDDKRVYGTVKLARPIALQTATQVHLVVRDSRADIYRDGNYVASVKIPAGERVTGQVQLGISVETLTDPQPYRVTFANVDERSY
jgi:hypothetical protein